MVDRHDEANATSVADSRTTDLGDKVDNQIALLDHIATELDLERSEFLPIAYHQ